MSKLMEVLNRDGFISKDSKKVIVGFLGFFVFLGVLWGAIALFSPKGPKGEEGIEQCIENGDFVEARKILAQLKESADVSSSNFLFSKKEGQLEQEKYKRCLNKVSKAQIASLIAEGDFDTAQNIALEDGNYNYYLDSFLGKLIGMYNKHGIDKVYEGLAQIKMPNDNYSYNKTVEQLNNAIEGLALVLVDTNKDDAKRLCSLLKPTKDYSDKKDYKEVEAIKKRIGIK